MTLTQWKILVDILLFITFFSLTITGLWPMSIYQHFGTTGFQLLHIEAGKTFIVLSLVHLALNWRWMKTHIFRRKARG